MNLKTNKQFILVVIILFIVSGTFAWLLYKSNKEEVQSLKNKQDENLKNDSILLQEQQKIKSDMHQLGYIVSKHHEVFNRTVDQTQEEAKRNPIGFKQSSKS